MIVVYLMFICMYVYFVVSFMQCMAGNILEDICNDIILIISCNGLVTVICDFQVTLFIINDYL